MAKKIKLSPNEKISIENTLLPIKYSKFEPAQEHYYELIDGDLASKTPRSRHAFSAKKLIKFLGDTEFFVVSVGASNSGDMRICFQKMLPTNDGKFTIDAKALSSFDPAEETHPVNIIPTD
jgi:hypothetical protein